MNEITAICSRIHALQQLPLSLVEGEDTIIRSWPEILRDSVRPEMAARVIRTFRAQNRDALHPLISFVAAGYFMAVIGIRPDLHLIIGLCSPYHHTRKELMELCIDTVYPEHMQQFCDSILRSPVIPLPQLHAYAALLTQLFTGKTIPESNILFIDSADKTPYSETRFSNARFRQREDSDEHTTLDYENGICQAITLGRTDLLIHALYATPGGKVGSMSSNALRQLRYSFISFATLISRAAIEGGLMREDAFLLSDLYCQRMDVLSDTGAIEQLLVGMAMDFCDKVAKNRGNRQLSPIIRKAQSFITVHLHDDFTMEDLASHCGLCRRSLSMRFKEETGLSVVDYVQKEKINEARFLLEHTELTLPDISAHLNYSSQSYFTTQFRKITGETPEKYRNKYR